MYNPFSLDGKTILVTGASSGIGRSTAIECSKMGADVVVTGRNIERLQETFNLLEGKGRNHIYLSSDIGTIDGLNQLITQLPYLDGCVSNAGTGKTIPVQFISYEELLPIYQLNCIIPTILTKELVRKRKLRKGASIVYTLSIAGNTTYLPGNSIYGSTKAALSAFVKYAALELAGKGIRCNGVSPGMINTAFINLSSISEDDRKKDIAKFPLKRYGEPEEVAYAIMYLLSDASSWVTGTNIIIDGGRSLV